MKKLVGVLLTMTMVILITLFTMNQGEAANENLFETTDAVKSVDIVFGGGDLYVETWDKEEIGFKVEKGQNSNGFDYQCYVEDSVLYVDGSQKTGNAAKKGEIKYIFIFQ